MGDDDLPDLAAHAARRFPDPHEAADALAVVEALGTAEWPVPGTRELPRVRHAVLHGSRGSMERLEDLALVAEIDYRDVLVAAGLAYPDWRDVLAAALRD